MEKVVEAKPLDLMKLEPFFMKIDVEGSEKSVLEGAFEAIASHLPVILIEIQNVETFTSISRELRRHNYICVALEPRKNLTHDKVLLNLIGEYRNSQNNYVWIPKESSSSWKFAQ